jgi:transporter family protein
MKPWILFAIVSMVFAGFTSVIAKMGLTGISGELGLAVRTGFVFVIVLAITIFHVPASQWASLDARNYWWLGLSGVTTSLSWLYYYKALKLGEVSTIALIDKGSIVIAVLLAAVILKEKITLNAMIGGALVISGILVIARK